MRRRTVCRCIVRRCVVGWSILIAWAGVCLTARPAAAAPPASHDAQPAAAIVRPWPPEKAWKWYKAQPWIIGCNYIPSTACNWTEMWQVETFDPATIDRELGFAQGLGFNTVRVFFQFIVWEHDPAAFQDRFEHFLKIADKHGIAVMPVFFDDCVIGTHGAEPFLGKQPEPEPGRMFSSWTPSPGHKRSQDRKSWPKFQEYIQSTIRLHANDHRVRIWDLYNEVSRPQSLPLLESSFAWAQQVNPDQPITACEFGTPPEKALCMAQSDIVTFHNYGPAPVLLKEAVELMKHGRPLVCTEWLARGYGSRPETHLHIFKAEGIGALNWGLVNGRSQTNYPWGANLPVPKVWHHDLLYRDGKPFSESEAALFRRLTGVH